MSDLRIAVVLYERMTALDAVGPIEVLRFLPGTRLELVSDAPGPVGTDSEALDLVATTAYDDCVEPDVVVVPGGPGTAEALGGPLIPWLQRVHPTTTWTTSVCSGSLLLAHAGLLEGAPARFSHGGALGGYYVYVVHRSVLSADQLRSGLLFISMC